MLIHCVYSIQDFVLEGILINYISKTPFLVAGGNISNSSFTVKMIPTEADLIVIEADLVLYEKIRQVKAQLRSKHFLVLTDITNLLELPPAQKMIILPKTISYPGFIEGLSLLADNR